ncbi:peptide chain release factor N(5)-glutamine methyltransferase [Hydrogenovibrio kuenenii]|uniref:peptide chain release factor N(5)-glutamine methyltransferase n=1 Tax=Hydrogenovibrio kuenenii TaxID=63658 RepID=UPI00046412AC|nr:peptide chain release factor N(5)-glutamine methyltransferase [Hydrogenovibrio kuenenii]
MTVAEALSYGKSHISSDSPVLDAELLLAYTLGKNRTFLFTWPETELSAAQESAFEKLIKKRQAGIPIAHLIGRREFWGMDFKVTEDTLIPRPDTEILVEQTLTKIDLCQKSGTASPKVLDLGTGSGAIICALKNEIPTIQAYAVDYQAPALEIAKQNAKNHALDINFKLGSWLEPFADHKFNIIVSNPPYIEENDPHLKQGDVRFEPITALTSGEDGLRDIQTLIKNSRSHLEQNGWLLIEHGYNQADAVQQLLIKNDYQKIETFYDYGNNPRVTMGCYTNKEA